MAKSKCVAIKLVAVFAVSIFAAPFMATAEETNGKSANAAGKENKPPESKRIDLGDGLVLEEYREFKEGKMTSLVKTYTRDGVKVMQHSLLPQLGVELNTYFRDGKAILGEELDSKSRIISLALYADNGSVVDAFERQANGTTTPISSKKLQGFLRAQKFMDKNFTPFADAVKKGDKKEADERLDSMIEKIKAGEFDAADEEPSGAAK